MEVDQKILDFLEGLNQLTTQHGIYISTLLDENGLVKDNLHLIYIEKNIQSAGYYTLNNLTDEIVFSWN